MTQHPTTDGQRLIDVTMAPNELALAVEFAQTLRHGATTVAALAGTGSLGPAAGRAGDVALVPAGWQGPLQLQFRSSAATEAARAVAVEQALLAEADAWEQLAASATPPQVQPDRSAGSPMADSSGGRVPPM